MRRPAHRAGLQVFGWFVHTRIFCSFVGELKQIVDNSRCTPTHEFIGRLYGQGKLLRCYTQNIDCLEQQAGLLVFDDEKEVIAACAGGEGAAPRQTGNVACAGHLDAIADAESVRPPKSRKSRPKLSSNPLVQLHGSLQQLYCTLCSATFPFTDKYRDEFKNGELPPCPQCEKQTEARRLAGKRRTATGTLRPSIVLYNEPHPRGDLVARILVADIRRKPDLLLVMGTSLKVTGLKSLVKDMAKGIHAAGGCCLFVNKTEAASVKEWSTVFDYQVLADTDEWVGDVDRRIAKLRGPEQRTLVKSATAKLALSRIETTITPKSPATGTCRAYRLCWGAIVWDAEDSLLAFYLLIKLLRQKGKRPVPVPLLTARRR
ncbi:MAG: DHS-like NAD/FAD-binding domain-containing protein [Olpidium bornovanus]|uniref:DHS-like NAD/FAD-binding domain-containing protein n=1 Tax=Olpidium bornovanus TaxID=278681 RepID=A0A8H8DKT0_9FUNG|nr:MAG: DHS-like NAD/FAD-binding domain-containing protein [Olpidium bornovanus]